jgi:hypothetical protein
MTELFRPVEGIELESLGTVISEGSSSYPRPEQYGPVRWYDKTLRCASRGCSSPTYCKLKGTPYCLMHIIGRMNEMLLELGVDT